MEREIGRGPRSVVYEATQLSLGRRVALKLFEEPPISGELRWPEHPRVVSLYGAGPCDQGYFVAMQLVRGPSLAELRGGDRLRLLGDVAEALDAAHRSGIAHGAVAAHNVLVSDGRAYLSDFGLGSGTQAEDLVDFAALVSDCVGVETPRPLPPTATAMVADARLRVAPSPRVRPRWALPGAVAGCAAIAAVVLASSGGSGEAPPARLPGALVLGSSLSGSGARSVDCSGASPSGASTACVVAQTRLNGRPVTARRDGVVRRWAVRGARGQVALEVLRRIGRRTYPVAHTAAVDLRDAGLHLLPANLPVRAGDLVALDVAPGAAVGVRDADGATTRRRFGADDVTPGSFDAATADQELLLRVEYMPGATWRPTGLLSGAAAAHAPTGAVLDSLEPYPGLTVAAVSVGGRVAADLLDGKRRLARLFVAGASSAGRLGSLYTIRVRFGVPIMRLLWHNPRGVVSRDFAATRRALVPFD